MLQASSAAARARPGVIRVPAAVCLWVDVSTEMRHVGVVVSDCGGKSVKHVLVGHVKLDIGAKRGETRRGWLEGRLVLGHAERHGEGVLCTTQHALLGCSALAGHARVIC